MEWVRDFKHLTSKNLSEKQLKRNASTLVEAHIINLKKPNWDPFAKNFGNQGINSNTPILECLDFWLAHRKKKFELGAIGKQRLAASINIHKQFSNWIKKELMELKSPSAFTELDISLFFDVKTKECNWGKETFNSYRDDLKNFFIFLMKEKVIDFNPVSGIERKSTIQDGTMYVVYEEDELNLVMKLLRESPEYVSLLISCKILYYYSIRLEEQLKLQVKDYNPAKKILTIPRAKTKNKNDASYEIDDDLNQLLSSFIYGSPPEYFIFGSRGKPNSKRLAYGYLGQKWRKFRKKFNLDPKLKLYALKHTSSFYSLQGGESWETLSLRLRHSSPSATQKYTKKITQLPIKRAPDNKF